MLSPGLAWAIARCSVGTSSGTRIADPDVAGRAGVTSRPAASPAMAATRSRPRRSRKRYGRAAGSPALTSTAFSRAEARYQPPCALWVFQNFWPGVMNVSATGLAYG